VATKDKTLSPRKAPSQARAHATVERILQGARQLLRDRGAEAVNTRAIAEVSGVRTGSIYQYFPNKASILYALYGRRMQQTVDAIEAALTPEVLSTLNFEQAWGMLGRANQSVGWGSDEDVALDKAIGEDPELRQAVAPVLNDLYRILSRIMRHYGSDWPDDALRDLSEYLFSINHFGYATRIRQAEQQAKMTRALTQELELYLALKAINSPYEPLA